MFLFWQRLRNHDSRVASAYIYGTTQFERSEDRIVDIEYAKNLHVRTVVFIYTWAEYRHQVFYL